MHWQKPIKKTVYTLNIDGYAPEITEMTYPFLRYYANKIGANFYIIDGRKYPGYPPVYEKLQIYDLGREHGNDWNIYLDSDALVHPDLFDVTNHLQKDTVLHNGHDIADNRWRYDQYFLRDGRHIGSCNWFTVASDWCLDLWHPLEDLTLEQAVERIRPVLSEARTIITPEHLIDDYTLSRNIARYGLKFTSMFALLAQLNDKGNYLWHQYTVTPEQKVLNLSQTIRNWHMDELLPVNLQQRIRLRTHEPEENGQTGENVLATPFFSS